MSKYHAKKVQYDGLIFDSRREATRWAELKLLQRAGKISDLTRQEKFLLIPRQTEMVERISPKTGKRLKSKERVVEPACYYIADFCYLRDGHLHVEDSKGFRTEGYKIKRKLMLERYGIRIEEV